MESCVASNVSRRRAKEADTPEKRSQDEPKDCKEERDIEKERKKVPIPMLSLQERAALSCLAAFFRLSPLALRNCSTQASLQNFSCDRPRTR